MKNKFRDCGLVISIICLVIVMLAMSVVIYSFSTTIFWICAPFILGVCSFAVGKLIQVTRRNFQYYVQINEEIDVLGRVSMYNFPMAVAIVDKADKLVWCNKYFSGEFPEQSVYGSSIRTITGKETTVMLANSKCTIQFGNSWYEAYASVPKEEESRDLLIVCFKNITQLVELETELTMTHPVVVTVVIDSYEEMFNDASESETARVTVQIDKALEDFVERTTGIMKKLQRDRFLFILEERHIKKLIEEKFKILDIIREIRVNDRMNVTLSIGVGRLGTSLAESEGYARQALDMALGRGGDQAAVKTETGFEFYGGVSKGIERQTKVRTRVVANSLIELIKNANDVYIMGHRYSDLDSIGSAVGLVAAIRRMNKVAYAVVDRSASLGIQLIDRVKAADRQSPFISPGEARAIADENSLIIIVDTHNPNLVEDQELYKNAKNLAIIDHHRKMVNYIDTAALFHHEPYASSASEMITELLQYFGDAGKIPSVYAEALLAGIMLDTKNFSIKTGVRTFEAAAALRKLGADTINVKSLFANDLDTYKVKVGLVANARIYKNCAIAISDEVMSDMRVIAPQTADELLGVTDIIGSFVIYRCGTDEIYISGRSLGAINVQVILEYLGGGGHQTMAGAQIKNVSAEEAYEMLMDAINKYLDTIKS